MAQKGEVLYGTVSDASNGEPVPFATVTLKKSLIGTTTNESGQFELHLPDTLQEDELLVTFLKWKLPSVT
ncbi:MAG: carboxypeptidase-like regulatory domain-containing protein [Bacteroidetes bacterium]|nr:carboxypeptidase-like regulatory domain-containing protein [Bacteroidota bacterium]